MTFISVQDVFDLWNEHGKSINSEVNIGDELIQIDGLATKGMGATHLKQAVDGDPGTLVQLQFRDLVTNQLYDIRAQRHLPQVSYSLARGL